MPTLARVRAIAAVAIAAGILAACTSDPADGGQSASPASTAPTSASPAPTATPAPEPLPPLAPGTARGGLLVVQRAEDAALVSGGDPIRLTLTRTQNDAAWFTAPPTKLAGAMTTEEAMLTLGWRPADDGTTAPMPAPRPNALLAHQSGTLAFTVLRANVRGDGTLVLDIRPIGAVPETVESFGPVSLTIDGVPGVLELGAPLTTDLSMRVIIMGNRNQQAVVQAVDASGAVIESAFVSTDRPVVDSWVDVAAGTTLWSDPIVTFVAPTAGKAGSVRVSGMISTDGSETPLSKVVARWSIPQSR